MLSLADMAFDNKNNPIANLKETGYDYLYMEDISRVASVVRKELGLD